MHRAISANTDEAGGAQTGELGEIRNADRMAHLSYLETGCILLMNYNLWTTFKSRTRKAI